ncbi:hypothetical protein G9464_10410 [Halostella sp. JP-L12]|uniref:hypothetical protein n=1 Tax=Halostella TaxID=1843185 RepID=UPI0013CE48B1|nr:MULTISPECIES: hypothetical protein [Halostella]NHN48008.1 hypothetical protein [Halostella sp. JP-L12]
MTTERVRAYWNDQALTETNGYRHVFGTWSHKDGEGPEVAVSPSEQGFYSVLACPDNSNRILSLTLDRSPETGTYVFTPPHPEYDFKVRIEYEEPPYPAAEMLTLDVQSSLCNVSVGDDIVIGLRKDATVSPGTKEIQGDIVQLVDSCGAVPDYTSYNLDYSDHPVLSMRVRFADAAPLDDGQLRQIQLTHRLETVGDGNGTLDLYGTGEPFEIRWEGPSDTPALSVEWVRIEPSDGQLLEMTNDTLPAVEFTPLSELSVADRIAELGAAFDRMPNVAIADDALRLFAESVNGTVPERELTVQYESAKSGNILTKSGTFVGVESAYYADPNRARHKISFTDSTRHYVLVDPLPNADSPVSVYSKSYNRFWDTDLGDVVDISISTE